MANKVLDVQYTSHFFQNQSFQCNKYLSFNKTAELTSKNQCLKELDVKIQLGQNPLPTCVEVIITTN